MKRLLALAMSAVMALSLTACTSGTDNSSSVPEQSSSVAEERAINPGGRSKGTHRQGMVKLMEDDAAGTTANDYESLWLARQMRSIPCSSRANWTSLLFPPMWLRFSTTRPRVRWRSWHSTPWVYCML